MSRPAVWVGMFGDQHLRVEVLRVYKYRVRCRVTEPGPYCGTVQDFHPADVVEPGQVAARAGSDT